MSQKFKDSNLSQENEDTRRIDLVIILPGNGCTPVKHCNWYHAVQQDLIKHGIETVLRDMPDPYVARRSIWIPFIHDILKEYNVKSENLLLIGHSSGAVCTMRFAEENKLAGAILVSPCITDLGDENERASGYYDDEWLWKRMKQNVPWFVQFSSSDDHLIPYETEMVPVAKNLDAEHHSFSDYGHFLFDHLPELVTVVKEKVKQCNE